MANSTSVTFTTGKGNVMTYTLSVSQAEQSITGNWTKLNWSLSAYAKYSVNCKRVYKAWVDNEFVWTGTVNQSSTGTHTVASGSKYVYHNSAGDKSVELYLYVDTTAYPGGSKANTDCFYPSTIPRRTTSVSVSGLTWNDGSSVRVDVSPHANFTHELWWRLNSEGTWIHTSDYNFRSWESFKVPISEIRKYPNSTTIPIQMSLRTKNGNSAVGDDYNFTRNLSVSHNYHAYFSSLPKFNCLDETQSKFGKLVEGKSKVNIKASVSPSVAGGTIKSVYARHHWGDLTGSSVSSNGGAWTSEAFVIKANVSDSSHTWVKVKDSRGRIATERLTADCFDYSEPFIYVNDLYRCEVVNGRVEKKNKGTRLCINVDYSITSLGGKNSKYLKLEYKSSADNTWHSELISLNEYKKDGFEIITNEKIKFEKTLTYAVKLKVCDYFDGDNVSVRNVQPPVSISVPTGFTVWSVRQEHGGFAVGKYCTEKDLFDVDLPARFRKDVEFDTLPSKETIELFKSLGWKP